MLSVEDSRFMTRALGLAQKGLYTTTPNPRVGAVIVKEGMIVGEGWHAKAGEPHAEIHAIRNVGENAEGSTLYVTLEPCSHHGRTPPCADAVINSGISRVVVAMKDPNPLVSGRGIQRLEEAGITVECGLFEDEAFELNPGFVSRMTRGRPWVRLKVAASLDGRTALSSGTSKWITGRAARRDGHRYRARSCAILTGIGTVLQDDPMLDVREVETTRQPLKIVLDSKLRLTGRERIFQGKTLVVSGSDDGEGRKRLESAGAEVIFLPDGNGRVDLERLMSELGKRGINELHVEAGEVLNGSLLKHGLVDEFVFYYSPCLIGRGKGMFDFPGLERMEDRFEIKIRDIRMVGKDLKIVGRPNV